MDDYVLRRNSLIGSLCLQHQTILDSHLVTSPSKSWIILIHLVVRYIEILTQVLKLLLTSLVALEQLLSRYNVDILAHE